LLKKGFNLIEVLIIVGIIGAILTIVLVVLNPSKILEKSRDSQRFADLKSISEAVNQYLAAGFNFEGLSGPYSSIDTGFASDRAREKIDGSGWIPLKLEISSGKTLSNLPLDPLNTVSHHYRFGISPSSKTYEIDASFESEENISKASSDDGNNPNVYELGTDLTLL